MVTNIGDQTIIKQKKPLKISDFYNSRVELAGVEPASKQGNHTLSTRLFWPSVFERQQDPDHQLSPYPLNLHQRLEAATGYFRLDLHRLIRMVRKKSS